MQRDADTAFVEDLGLFLEANGQTRMAGRLLGWLMICDPPHQSAAQLADGLRASAGSVSTTTRMLEAAGLIERFTAPGDRRTWYRMREGAWTTLILNRQALLARLGQLAGAGLRAMPATDSAGERGDRLRDLAEMSAFMEHEFSYVVKRWEARKAARAAVSTAGRTDEAEKEPS